MVTKTPATPPATKKAATKKATKKATPKTSTALKPKPTAGKKTAMDDDPIYFFDDAKAFEVWLKKNHQTSTGAWLQHVKKGAKRTSVSYSEALDISLCWGWIDGQKRSHDDETFLQRYSPRGARSMWSSINCGKVQRLIDEGRMTPAGMRHVDAARADGRWDNAYAPVSQATVPDDLAAALAAVPGARPFFDTLKSVNRYAILHRLMTAKRPETRAKRIALFVDMCARGETIH